MKICRNCKKSVQDDWKYCPYCGEDIPSVPLCENCGKELDPSWKACPFCGIQTNKPNSLDAEPSNNCSDWNELLNLSEETKAFSDNIKNARALCIREKFEDAEKIYNAILDEDPANADACIGLVRVLSKNYTLYEGEDIQKHIGYVTELTENANNCLDNEYTEYINRRDDLLKNKEEVISSEALTEDTDKENAPVCDLETGFGPDFKMKGTALVKYLGKSAVVTIPNGVTSIGRRAFYNCRILTRITLPESVIRINSEAFLGCTSLQSVELQKGLTHIGNSAFRGCTSLKQINIPNTLKAIDGWVFKECKSLKQISLPKRCTFFEDGWWNSFESTCKVIYI